MNNAFRGVILAIALLGMAFMFFGMIDSLDNGSTEFTLEDLANALTAGLGMVSCAIIGGAALAGMTPSPPKAVTFPPQPGAVPPQGQPYPQPGAVPQQYAPQHYLQQQYAAQQYPQQHEAQPGHPRQD
ncbi:hypothetical protein ACN3XK_46095 [Actinomadura welshii]